MLVDQGRRQYRLELLHFFHARRDIARACRFESDNQLAIGAGGVDLGTGQTENRPGDLLHAFRAGVNYDTGDVQFLTHW